VLCALASRLLRGLLSAQVLTVVVPTLSGREDSLARGIASYEDTLAGVEHEIIVIKDRPTWPAACNEGYEKSKGDVILFTSDDLEAMPGWWEHARDHLAAHDELPAPRVYNFLYEESEWDNTEDGPDGATHNIHGGRNFTRIPIMRRDQWERIGRWPDDLIYYADLWVSEKALVLGIETRMVHGYDFIHHWSGVRRVDSRANLDASGIKLKLLREQWT
jgi:glycosyltransferase involved in cell wall biosynthesis